MDFAIILTIAITGVIFVIYFFVITPLRKSKYKKLANDLRAKYIPQGPFSIGKIVGTIDTREFVIQTYTSGSGKSSTICTKISLNSTNQGISLVITKNFFKNYPNWKAIFTKGKSKKREFFTYIDLNNGLAPLDKKHRDQIHSVLQEVSETYNKYIRKGDIEINKTSINFTMQGIVKESDKIRKILDLLSKIAYNIENNPVK